MTGMSSNSESTRRDFGDSVQLTNWILNSGATCHMTAEISNFITGSLVETDKYIDVSDGHFVTLKQTGEVKIKMHHNNGKPFITTLYKVTFAPDLCNSLFSIITLINLGYTCLFHKGFCTVFFRNIEQNVVTMPHSEQKKHYFLVKTKEKSKSQKQIPKNKFSLELLNKRIGHRSTRSLLAGYTANFWQEIKIRVDPDSFCASCQISKIN